MLWLLTAPAALVACVLAWYHLLPRLAAFSLRWRLALAYRRLARLENHYQHQLNRLEQRLELKDEELTDLANAHLRVMSWVSADNATAAAIANHLAPVPPQPPEPDTYAAELELERRQQKVAPTTNGINPRARMTHL